MAVLAVPMLAAPSPPPSAIPATALDPATSALPPSEYADQMPLLRELSGLDPADPRRRELRDRIVVAFLPVVDHLARRYSAHHRAAHEDLRQVGTVALITAVDRWDPLLARGEFLGYLIPCVRGEILRWFRDRTWAMRVPRRLKDLTVAIGRVTGPMAQELGRSPRPSELAARLDIDVAEVIEALQAGAQRQAASLDAIDAHTGTTPGDHTGYVDEDLSKVEYRHALRPLLDALPERERAIVVLRFFGELTQTQIGQEMGISQMHVSRLLTRTIKHLRTRLLDDVPAKAS